jgi:hypothetical protein
VTRRGAAVPNEFTEAGDLLKSEALRAISTAIAAARDLPVVDSNPVATLNSAMNDLWLAKLSPPDARRLLEQDKDLITRLAVRHSQITTRDPLGDHGKFAPGEELEPAGEAVLLGLGPDVGITWAIYLHFLRGRTVTELRTFLKKRGSRRAAASYGS